jgi:Mrp family chromosome partitioning ATPase
MGSARVQAGERTVDSSMTRPMEKVTIDGPPRFLDETDPRMLTTPRSGQRVTADRRRVDPAALHGGPTEVMGNVMVRDESAVEASSVEVRVGVPVVPRTQVWVATHRVPEDPDERLILVREPDSARAATFRVMRHRLQERGDPRIIAVTSPDPCEGKTTCAVNLALALGECGRARVLLIEANLRAPTFAPMFGFLPPECFSTQMLRHKEKPLEPWSVVEVFTPSLHVLAVKPDTRDTMLDGPAFSLAIEMLARAGYDYLVIDTPPVIGAADVNLIEDSADGLLFTAWSRETSARRLRQAVEQLAPAKILGLALVNV